VNFVPFIASAVIKAKHMRIEKITFREFYFNSSLLKISGFIQKMNMNRNEIRDMRLI